MPHQYSRLLMIAALVLVFAPSIVLAQETRSELITRQAAEKAKQVEPSSPGKIESFILFFERRRPLDDKNGQAGWYPKLGGLAPGAGLALGAGYRHPLPWGRAQGDVSASFSFRGYRRLDLVMTVPELAGRPLDLRAGVRYRDLPRERFYGLGPVAAFDDRTTFGLRDIDYTVALIGRPTSRWNVGVEAGYLDAALGAGTDKRFALLEQRFSDRDAPGLAAQPDFLHSTIFVEVNSLDMPENPRAGGLYRLALGRFHDVGRGRFSFNQYEAEASHVFPFFNTRRAIAIRGLVIMTDPDSGNEVPFYLMPSLGGSDRLRGYDLARFRDRNAMLMGLEYRWEVFAALDMALFVDAGKVTREIRQLDFRDLQVTPGIGFRINAREKLIVRLDLARGREGMQAHVRFRKAW